MIQILPNSEQNISQQSLKSSSSISQSITIHTSTVEAQSTTSNTLPTQDNLSRKRACPTQEKLQKQLEALEKQEQKLESELLHKKEKQVVLQEMKQVELNWIQDINIQVGQLEKQIIVYLCALSCVLRFVGYCTVGSEPSQ